MASLGNDTASTKQTTLQTGKGEHREGEWLAQHSSPSYYQQLLGELGGNRVPALDSWPSFISHTRFSSQKGVPGGRRPGSLLLGAVLRAKCSLVHTVGTPQVCFYICKLTPKHDNSRSPHLQSLFKRATLKLRMMTAPPAARSHPICTISLHPHKTPNL